MIRLRKSWQLFLSFTHKKSWHISKSDIASWVSDLRSQHLSPETINLRLAALSSFYTYVTQTYTHLSPEGVEQPLYHYNPVKASIPTERTCPSGVLSADESIIFLTKSGESISTPINFIIHNRGLGQIKWNIGENPPVDWLSMSPKNGISTPLYSTPISSSINDDVISSGVYNTTLKISTGAGTKNSPLSIPIRVISKLEDLSLLEGNALVSLYVATQGSSWTNNTDWLDTNKPCSWYGVDCSAGHVSRLNLTNDNLVGTIPNVLSDITNLDHLDLSSNPLTGSLPLSITKLELKFFAFDNTGLCEPNNGDFQNWLSTIPDLRRTGISCSSGFENYFPIILNPEIDIVKNGSFEEGIYAPDNPPNNWNRVIWEASDADLTWEDSQSIEGSKSVKIDASEPNDARWVQTVTVEPFTEYRLSGWIKTESVSHSVDLEDAGANLCLCDEWGRTEGLFGDNEWTKVEMTFHSGNRNEVTVGCRLGYFSGLTTGKMWCDDIRVEAIP